MADTVEKVAAVIPGTYYDIIARVVPGAASVGMFMWVNGISSDWVVDQTGIKGAALATVGIGLAYLVGLLLTPLGSVLCELPVALVKRVNPGARIADASSDRLWQRIAEVDATLPSAGATLAKMSAEATLCQNLLAGTLVVWLLSLDSVPVWLALAAVGTSAVNVAFRTFVLVRRVEELRRTLR